MNGTLENASKETTPLFNIQTGVKAKVISVYDGDTFTAAVSLPIGEIAPGTSCGSCGNIDLQTTPVAFKCRIAAIDTPELRTRNKHEKQLGYIARDKVCDLIMDKMVTLDCHGFDKYGRLLVSVFEKSAGDIGLCLVGSKLAVQYNGGKKVYDWGTHRLN